MKILVATNNSGKQAEFEKILSDFKFEVIFPKDIGLEEFDVDETGETFKENSFLKAEAFAQESGLLTLADDSGLEIAALNGAPGVHSKRFFAGSESDRNQKMLEMLEGKQDRFAKVTSVLCFYDPKKKEPQYFEGVFKGEIGFEEKGEAGFGFDTIFIPFGEKKTVAQLGLKYKNRISHRALALKKLGEYFKKLF
jgi:XTP/dITP diphosphohydrolase